MSEKDSELADKKCKSCSGEVEPFDEDKVIEYASKISENWNIIDNHHLECSFDFDNFKQALDFTNIIGELAEKEGHHPDICLSWGECRVKLYTHKIDGLWESDFIMAAKIEKEYQEFL